LQRDLASDDASARAAGVDYLRRCIDVAIACGATIVGGPLFGSPLVFAGRAPSPIDEAPRRERVKRVTEGLRAVAEFAEGSDVRFTVEPLNRFETDFCNTARQAPALCTLVDHPSVGIMLDTFHMNIEEDDLPQAIRLAGPLLIHFQANENHRGFLGTGHIDWSPICRALAEIDYQGAVTLEPFRRTGHLLSLPLAQWRPPGRDEDADLRASGDFLRGALHAARRQ
jgi:D-psicose/D-tagatose/L-ribulose 3-epimerase